MWIRMYSGLVDRGELERHLTCDCWDSWLLDIVMFVDILLAAFLVTFVDNVVDAGVSRWGRSTIFYSLISSEDVLIQP